MLGGPCLRASPLEDFRTPARLDHQERVNTTIIERGQLFYTYTKLNEDKAIIVILKNLQRKSIQVLQTEKSSGSSSSSSFLVDKIRYPVNQSAKFSSGIFTTEIFLLSALSDVYGVRLYLQSFRISVAEV